jgi:hypothetical protein
VVRWFFRVGGAAGTIAKSMSAYDMAVSDAVYGKTERYVCRPRLQSMLDHEYQLDLDRLAETRGETTSFFAFADTVAARSYRNTHEAHGWMGVKFQSRPRDQSSQIIIHVRMLDSENALQQEALGIVGVNLLYGAFFLASEPELLIESLLDGLTTQRLSIDMIELSGIEFRQVDNRLMSMKLVQMGLSGAAMFDPQGTVLVDAGFIKQLENVNRAYLPIFSRDALRKIRAGDPTWEAMVPAEVAEVIKRRRFLGYRAATS